MFFRTYSPQGDGNKWKPNDYHLIESWVGFSEPIPRKGTETNNYLGDKALQNKWRFSEPIPRKGTETSSREFNQDVSQAKFFRTYSPQGDGNDD